MGNPWINGDFTYDLSDNEIFRKNEKNYIDALGIQQLNTIGNIYFLDIYLSKDNCVEMHYHPNASELTYCISGSVEVSFINPNNNEWESFELNPGEAVSIPQGFWHVACALTDDTHLLATHDTHLLATHDTNNLQTVFGSDLLRITPAEYFAHIYCLNEKQVEETLAPITDTVIIGPPADCERDEAIQEAESTKRQIQPELKKAERQSMYHQMPTLHQEVHQAPSSFMKDNVEMETKASVPYGGTFLRPIHLCENCLKEL